MVMERSRKAGLVACSPRSILLYDPEQIACTLPSRHRWRSFAGNSAIPIFSFAFLQTGYFVGELFPFTWQNRHIGQNEMQLQKYLPLPTKLFCFICPFLDVSSKNHKQPLATRSPCNSCKRNQVGWVLSFFLPLVEWVVWVVLSPTTDKLNQLHSGVCTSVRPGVARTVLWQALFLWPKNLYTHCSDPVASFFQRIFIFTAGAQKVITDLTTPSQRADALGKLGICFGIGIIIGSALGGVLSTKFGWVVHLFGVGLVATLEGAAKGYFASSLAFGDILLLVAVEDHTRTQHFAFRTATKNDSHCF